MRLLMLAFIGAVWFAGCTGKDIQVSGMICPPGHTEQMVHEDFRACRAYDEKEAEKATFPKKLETECQECLIKRGYKIDE